MERDIETGIQKLRGRNIETDTKRRRHHVSSLLMSSSQRHRHEDRGIERDTLDTELYRQK